MVSLFAFIVTTYGMNPYLVATFNSGLACETAKSSIIAAALEQNLGTTSTYSMAPRNLKCINTPGIVAAGPKPPDLSALKAASSPAPAAVVVHKRPAKK